MGIVFYPRYFEWFDACTIALFAAAGFPKQAMLEKYDLAGIPIVAAKATFLIPSKYGDELTVETAVTEFRRSSFDVDHRVLKNGELAVEASETRVWTGRNPVKSKPIPAEVIEQLKS
jgi:4-hydroxybenzoyl-CoA thioesterase